MTKIQTAKNKSLTLETEVEETIANPQPSSQVLMNPMIENINEIASKAAFQSDANGTCQSILNIHAQQLNDLFHKLPALEAKLEENFAKVNALSHIIENESKILDEETRRLHDPEADEKFYALLQATQELKQDFESLKLKRSTRLKEEMPRSDSPQVPPLDSDREQLEDWSIGNTQNDIAGVPSIEDIRKLVDDLAEVNHSLQNVSATIADSLGEVKEFAEQSNTEMLQVMDGLAQATQLAQENAELAIEQAQASAELNQASIKTLETVNEIEKTAVEIQQISIEDNYRLENIVRAAMNHRQHLPARTPRENLVASNELSTINPKDEDNVIVKVASDNCFVAFFQKFHEFLSRIISFIFCSCTPAVVYRSIVPLQQ